MEYSEDTWPEFGVKHVWRNSQLLDSHVTSRGTHLEMIHRPGWGVACYMDNAIQSCEADEHLYHESLVHPVMASGDAKRVMIIGGGEGATAREVLKWPVQKVDMYEWDADVVSVFKAKYPQWAKGAWSDKRLSVYFDDIFQTIKTKPEILYDVIIIDLFDPEEENLPQWEELLKNLKRWMKPHARIVIFSGIRNVLRQKQNYEILADMIKDKMRLVKVTPYKVFIPSFSGESTFLLIANPISEQEFSVPSHLTNEIWESYKVFNY